VRGVQELGTSLRVTGPSCVVGIVCDGTDNFALLCSCVDHLCVGCRLSNVHRGIRVEPRSRFIRVTLSVRRDCKDALDSTGHSKCL
jgi:hypothetical protein